MQLDTRCRRRRTWPSRSVDGGVAAGIGAAQDLARAAPRRPARAALPLTKVWREALVLPASRVRSVSPVTSSSVGDRNAERVGGDLRHDRVASPGRYRPRRRTAPRGRRGVMPTTISDGLDRLVLPMPYHMQAMPDAAPQRAVWRRVERRRRRPQRVPARPQRVEAFRQRGAVAEHLAGGGGAADAERVAVAELQRVEAELRRPACPSAPRRRSPPAARRSRGRRRRAGRWCGSPRWCTARCGTRVRPAGVDRHAVGDRRAPARIGAGVEVAVEAERGQPPVRVAGGLGA